MAKARRPNAKNNWFRANFKRIEVLDDAEIEAFEAEKSPSHEPKKQFSTRSPSQNAWRTSDSDLIHPHHFVGRRWPFVGQTGHLERQNEIIKADRHRAFLRSSVQKGMCLHHRVLMNAIRGRLRRFSKGRGEMRANDWMLG